uniref:Uncharacterized protein n=1 Tax=Geospiza parvula TaxID=87175 RepID=A0A8C3M7U8_GEOPR
MHHCRRLRSPEQDGEPGHRWKRRRSRSRECEGRLRYPPRRELARRSRSRSHERMPYQRRCRRDSDACRLEECSPSLGQDYCPARPRPWRRSRGRGQHQQRPRRYPQQQQQQHCRRRRSRSCSSASSVSRAGLVPSQDRTQLWATGAALPEAQRAGKKTCYRGFYWAACPN